MDDNHRSTDHHDHRSVEHHYDDGCADNHRGLNDNHDRRRHDHLDQLVYHDIVVDDDNVPHLAPIDDDLDWHDDVYDNTARLYEHVNDVIAAHFNDVDHDDAP